MLTIMFSPVKGESVSVDGLSMKVCPMFVLNENGDIGFLNNRSEFTDITDIEILFSQDSGFKRLDIDQKTLGGIITFLNEYHGKQTLSFDCRAFVNMLYKIENHATEVIYDFWKMLPFEEVPEVGSVIFFMNTELRLFRHAAVYIGEGFYISVYGAGGDMEISTFDDMFRDFEASICYAARPL